MRRILFESTYQGVWQQLLEGLTAYVRERQADWELHCLTLGEFLEELGRGPDGAVCVLNPETPKAVEHVLRAAQGRGRGGGRGGGGVPVVNMFRFAHAGVPTVMSDNEAIGERAAAYLLSRGFRHFAFLGPDREWSRERRAGFCRRIAGEGHGVEELASIGVGDLRKVTDARVQRRLGRWIEGLRRPVALFAAADFAARTCLHASLAMGLRVPEEVALLGVDNEIAICELAPVSLSSIPQDLHRIGYEAARLLDGMMAGRRGPARPVLIGPAELVVRRSTDSFAFDDPHVLAAVREIHATPVAELSMKGILRTAGVSRQWLDRRFKALVGKTPSQVIREVRLERARALLSTTHLPVGEIARRCGFLRAENFTRLFRSATGRSPGEYREGGN